MTQEKDSNEERWNKENKLSSKASKKQDPSAENRLFSEMYLPRYKTKQPLLDYLIILILLSVTNTKKDIRWSARTADLSLLTSVQECRVYWWDQSSLYPEAKRRKSGKRVNSLLGCESCERELNWSKRLTLMFPGPSAIAITALPIFWTTFLINHSTVPQKYWQTNINQKQNKFLFFGP